MKHLTTLSAITFLTFVSCNNQRAQGKPGNENPKALEDKNSSFKIASKRVPGDLMETLYQELADQTPELNEFERRLEILSDSENDSTRSFSIYDHKSILNSIKTKNITLTDLHTALKIIRTLPVIDKYQKNNLPATQPLQGYLNEVDKTIKQADTLIK